MIEPRYGVLNYFCFSYKKRKGSVIIGRLLYHRSSLSAAVPGKADRICVLNLNSERTTRQQIPTSHYLTSLLFFFPHHSLHQNSKSSIGSTYALSANPLIGKQEKETKGKEREKKNISQQWPTS